MSRKTTLKDARKKDKLEQFVWEHEEDILGDLDKLDDSLKRPASRKTIEPPEASKPDDPDATLGATPEARSAEKGAARGKAAPERPGGRERLAENCLTGAFPSEEG